jgi:uncharacterized membrane protein
LDLNLEEMFDMWVSNLHIIGSSFMNFVIWLAALFLLRVWYRFDAADKEQSFDDAIKKVKKED